LACDVRFIAGPPAASPALFARDGVVVVVNPQNTVVRLQIDQLRGVFSGRIVDWSQLGGRSGPIAAAVPDDNSDEAHELGAQLMRGVAIGPHVIRGYTGQQIARWVSSPSGARSIGVLPFSVALPAKVLAVGNSSPPSSLSIADGRYLMSVGVLAVSDFRFPSRPAAALLAFANSPEAGDPINRSALISKNGL
jgi:phosphate transport system substrate-binding protein